MFGLLAAIFAAKAEKPAVAVIERSQVLTSHGLAPPVFIKLHKVGSTTVSSFLACHGSNDTACCSCLRKEHVQCDGTGPWSHDVAIKYP